MSLFEIRNLAKVYGDRTVLDITDLQLDSGRIYGLLGPNGSGKTTLLEILSLLLHPTRGNILYRARPIDFSQGRLHHIRREIVMVHQNPVLFTTTVYKNLELGLRIRGRGKKERDRAVDEALDLVGMRDFKEAEAHRLSGGETQRVAIGRALACAPRVIFLDEPKANVDVENQAAIDRIIADINTEKKISLLFTTHNPIEVSRLSHEVVFLFEGRNVPYIVENIFSGKIVAAGNGATVCLLPGGVRLPVRTAKRGDIRLSIDPLGLRLAPAHHPDNDEEVLRGRLLQLTDENRFVRAWVDTGVPLTLLLPKEAVEKRPLLIGQEVRILCPPEAIQVL